MGVEFLDAVNNVTTSKRQLPRAETAKMAWGIKRFLSMNEGLLLAVSFLDKYHFPLGDGRFYDLMVYAMPSGRYRTKSIKSEDQEKALLSPGSALYSKVREFFKVEPEEVGILLEILRRQGKGIDDVKAFFGVNKRGKRARKGTASGTRAGQRDRAKVSVTELGSGTESE